MSKRIGLLMLIVVGRASAQQPMEIVDKAIKATAESEERLAKQKNTIQIGRGTYVTQSGELALTREATFTFAGTKLRFAGQVGSGVQAKPFVYIVNGLSAWARDGNETRDLPPAQYQTFREDLHIFHVTSLMPLKDKGTKLTAIPPAPVDGKLAVGVQVEISPMPPVQLYFESSGRLVRAIYKGTEAGLPVSKDYVFGGYKEFEGIQRPTRIIVMQNGRKTEDWTFDTYRFPAALPAATFNKP